jgi:hypothetical protein
MLMKFAIEQRHLTDAAGKPIPRDSEVTFHVFEAASADDAVRLYVRDTGAQVIGDVMKFPGFHAVATVRNTRGVYTLQVSPASGVRI